MDAEAYYLRCCHYIDCNPVRAGMVADPADYRWSSHRRLAFGERDPLLSGHEQYLRLGATPAERQRAYRALFVTDIDPADLDEIRSNTQRGWPIGSERFKDQIEQALDRAARPPQRGRQRKEAASGVAGEREKLL